MIEYKIDRKYYSKTLHKIADVQTKQLNSNKHYLYKLLLDANYLHIHLYKISAIS